MTASDPLGVAVSDVGPDRLATLSTLRDRARAIRREWSGPAASAAILGDQVGHIEPRLWTKPLRELRPAVLDADGGVIAAATSYGFDVITFARDVLQAPLDPWQEWLVIHAGELLPDGRPRFRKVLAMVARQNGKTHLLMVLLLFWLFVEEWPLCVGMSTTIDYAKEAWSNAVKMVRATADLQQQMPGGRGRGITDNNNKTELKTGAGCVYRLAARNRRGGRGLPIDRLVVDELREHDTYAAWSASEPALNARPFGQIWCITNAGDDTSVVLEDLRSAALKFIEGGEGDRRLGLFEWSSLPGAAIDDVQALAMANPNLGRRIAVEDLVGMARAVLTDPTKRDRDGVTAEARFRTEVMCQKVDKMDPAINPVAWKNSRVFGDLTRARPRIAGCVDLSPDLKHGTFTAAGIMSDGRVRVELVQVWEGPKALADMRRDLPKLVARVRPQRLGWFPGGPAASLDADLRDRTEKGRLRTAESWPPRGVTVAELAGEVSAVCMGFAALVESGGVVHSAEPLQDDHVMGAGRLHTGDTWRFSRRGEGHCDAAYAAAGAVHLARTLPAAIGAPRLVLPSNGTEVVQSRS